MCSRIVEFQAAARVAADECQQSRARSSVSVASRDPPSRELNARIFASQHWAEFASTGELQFVAETMGGTPVSSTYVRSLLQENRAHLRTDVPRAVPITFPVGKHSHVCVNPTARFVASVSSKEDH